MLESQIQLGLTYYCLGRTPEAIREWEAVREYDPGRKDALMYLRLVWGREGTPEPADSQGEGWSTRPLSGVRDATPRGSLEDVGERVPSLETASVTAFVPHGEAED